MFDRSQQSFRENTKKRFEAIQITEMPQRLSETQPLDTTETYLFVDEETEVVDLQKHVDD